MVVRARTSVSPSHPGETYFPRFSWHSELQGRERKIVSYTYLTTSPSFLALNIYIVRFHEHFFHYEVGYMLTGREGDLPRIDYNAHFQVRTSTRMKRSPWSWNHSPHAIHNCTLKCGCTRYSVEAWGYRRWEFFPCMKRSLSAQSTIVEVLEVISTRLLEEHDSEFLDWQSNRR